MPTMMPVGISNRRKLVCIFYLHLNVWPHTARSVLNYSLKAVRGCVSVLETEVNSCDPVVLWQYLTSLHDQDRITRWIESLPPQDADAANPTDPSRWPALAATVVNDNTACSSHTRNVILDMLAR